MKNGDAIRAMTDEELAEWVIGLSHGMYTCPPSEGCPGECVPCWLDWLQQEVDDDSR